MKPVPITLPAPLRQRLGDADTGGWTAVGNADLLSEPLLGLLASRQCPPKIMLSTLDKIPGWIEDGKVILSGFHSPLEQQVLHSLLRRKGRAVRLLARSLSNYSIPPIARPALKEGRLLILSLSPPEVRRTTRATALERNRLILTLSTETTVPHIAPNSPLATLINTKPHNNK